MNLPFTFNISRNESITSTVSLNKPAVHSTKLTSQGGKVGTTNSQLAINIVSNTASQKFIYPHCKTHGYYCDEVVVDAHHTPDTSIAQYGRRVDITVWKDADMTPKQK